DASTVPRLTAGEYAHPTILVDDRARFSHHSSPSRPEFTSHNWHPLAARCIVSHMSVELRELRKQYVGPDGASVPVIDVPEFKLGDGEHVGLIGGSGTGKTTLLHLIAGILGADSGNIIFNSSGKAIDITQ